MELRVAVKDASVLIDLANGDLIGHWFGLGISTIITESVRTEIRRGNQEDLIRPFIDAGLIQIDKVSDSNAVLWLDSISTIASRLRISFADATALICAKEKDAILLTGDGRLREKAQDHGVTVRGVLWVLDVLVWENVLGCEEAMDSLEAIVLEGARLPDEECERRRNSWSNGEPILPVGFEA